MKTLGQIEKEINEINAMLDQVEETNEENKKRFAKVSHAIMAMNNEFEVVVTLKTPNSMSRVFTNKKLYTSNKDYGTRWARIGRISENQVRAKISFPYTNYQMSDTEALEAHGHSFRQLKWIPRDEFDVEFFDISKHNRVEWLDPRPYGSFPYVTLETHNRKTGQDLQPTIVHI